MPRILCIAEKPSIAKAVSQILSGGQFSTKNTKNKYIKNYEFNFDFGPPWGKSNVIMSSVLGHTTSTDFSRDYNIWANHPPGVTFDIPTIISVDKDKQDVAENIRQQAKFSQILYIWTDCDREGEYIGTEVRDIARENNPRIQVKRANFNNLEATHILRAARSPIDLDERQAQAVKARIELDLRIGAAFTRLQTLKLRTLPGCTGLVISYGSCQFPCLGFVVDRFHKIARFVSERFWSIKVTHIRDSVPVKFTWSRNHLFDRMAVTLLFEQCLTARTAKVTKLIQKPTRKYKPLPLTTVELQKKGSQYLHLSSDQIMKTAESLYQKGFISYPRTETDQFDRGMDLRLLCSKQTNHPTWGAYAQTLVDGAFSQPRDGKNNDKAHPPIHPVICALPTVLTDPTERRVYEFVTRRFLACCSADAIGSTTTITLLYGPETFSTSGLIVLERNYLDVYPYERWTTNELPPFREGEEFEPTEAMMVEGKTTPPSYITEPELIALMDANGIGTDATMAEHIKTIVDRAYVFARTKGSGGGAGEEALEAPEAGRGRGARGRGRGSRGGRGGRGGAAVGTGGGGGVREFVPSTLGLGLVEGYDGMKFDVNLSKPFLRKEMEVKMKAICEGKKTREEVVRESLAMYREVFEKAERQIGTLIKACEERMKPEE